MKNVTVPEELPFTGERFTSASALRDSQIYHEHLHRYLFAAQCVRGAAVLDIACGEGYGSMLLATSAASVVGVDVSAETVAHAGRKYRLGNLRFLTGECRSIPLEAASIDVVVSFETIEHLDEHEAFMREIRRVLKPGGRLIISSPDREKYDGRGVGKNAFHKKELSRAEVAALMQQHFRYVALFDQKLVAGSSLEPSDINDYERLTIRGYFHGGLEGGEFVPGTSQGLYIVAVCSDAELTALPVGIFENSEVAAQIWDSFEILPALRLSYADTVRKLGELESKRAEEIESGDLSTHLSAQLRGQVAELGAEVEKRGRWGLALTAELDALRGILQKQTDEAEAWRVALVAAHEDDRRELRRQLSRMELDVTRQREASEANEVTAVLLRGENERKHATVVDLAERLSSAELEASRKISAEREEKTKLAQKVAASEEQLAAAQIQFAAALKENQQLMARINSVGSEVKWNRAQLERWQQSDHTLRQMQTSWSWRITAPLRIVHQWLGDPLYRRRR